MKKILAFLLISCTGCLNSTSNNNTGPTIKTNDPVVQTEMIDTSLSGIYKVTLPCSDCAGREQVLALHPDGQFRLQEQFIGKTLVPSISRGKWWKNGDEVQLMQERLVINTYRLQHDLLVYISPEADTYNFPAFTLQKVGNIIPEHWAVYKDLGIVFMAVGTEPFWDLQITKDKKLHLSMAGWNKALTLGNLHSAFSTDSITYVASDNKKILVTVYPQFCSDGMSDDLYEYRVTAVIDTLRLQGCGTYL